MERLVSYKKAKSLLNTSHILIELQRNGDRHRKSKVNVSIRHFIELLTLCLREIKMKKNFSSVLNA